MKILKNTVVALEYSERVIFKMENSPSSIPEALSTLDGLDEKWNKVDIVQLEALCKTGRSLRRNPNKNEEVKTLQKVLISLGIMEATYEKNGKSLNSADGFFGKGTESKVKELQKFLKIESDGVVGPQTRRALTQKLRALETKKQTEEFHKVETKKAKDLAKQEETALSDTVVKPFIENTKEKTYKIDQNRLILTLKEASTFHNRIADRRVVAETLLNERAGVRETKLGTISDRHGILGLFTNMENARGMENQDLIAVENFDRYQQFLGTTPENFENAKLLLDKLDSEKAKVIEKLLEQEGAPTPEQMQKVAEMSGERLDGKDAKALSSRIKKFGWETVKWSVIASLAASAASGVWTAGLFIEAFRITLGSSTDLNLVETRKLDIIARHAELTKKKAELKTLSEDEESLLGALEVKISKSSELKKEEFDLIQQDLKALDMYATDYYLQTTNKQLREHSKTTKAGTYEIDNPLEKVIDESAERNKRYEKVVVQAEIKDVRKLDFFLFRAFKGINTPEEAYAEVDEKIAKFEKKYLGTKMEKSPIPSAKKVKEYYNYIQLRNQLYNRNLDLVSREGHIIRTQKLDILEKENMTKLAPYKGRIKEYTAIAEQVLNKLEDLQKNKDGFIKSEIKLGFLSGSYYPSEIIKDIREKMIAINDALEGGGDRRKLEQLYKEIRNSVNINRRKNENYYYGSTGFLKNVLKSLEKSSNKVEVQEKPEWLKKSEAKERKDMETKSEMKGMTPDQKTKELFKRGFGFEAEQEIGISSEIEKKFKDIPTDSYARFYEAIDQQKFTIGGKDISLDLKLHTTSATTNPFSMVEVSGTFDKNLIRKIQRVIAQKQLALPAFNEKARDELRNVLKNDEAKSNQLVNIETSDQTVSDIILSHIEKQFSFLKPPVKKEEITDAIAKSFIFNRKSEQFKSLKNNLTSVINTGRNEYETDSKNATIKKEIDKVFNSEQMSIVPIEREVTIGGIKQTIQFNFMLRGVCLNACLIKNISSVVSQKVKKAPSRRANEDNWSVGTVHPTIPIGMFLSMWNAGGGSSGGGGGGETCEVTIEGEDGIISTIPEETVGI
ncbi:peptidoglycan-binding protein [Candidatus Gracilibacteria bacterium]|nr:peptidoglycan-binding protein [Candidatus Gracilibacteria bacterium]